MRAGGMTGAFEELFPVIKGSFLDGHLKYHQMEWSFTRWLDADGKRVWPFDDERVVRWERRTRCGLLIDWWTRDLDSQMRYTTIRADYAAAIAEPCRRCFLVED